MSAPSLRSDIDRLRSEHAVDDTMIDSLMAGPERARAHIALWARMMWTVNGALLATSLIGALLSARWALDARSVLSLLAFLALSFLVVKLASVLWAQRRALHAIRAVATRHGLI
ncbi:MAG: hypothetical protein WBF53_13565 [Litorimonas sp.]